MLDCDLVGTSFVFSGESNLTLLIAKGVVGAYDLRMQKVWTVIDSPS